MSKWVYDGYTKVHDDSRKHMIERWCYRCSECGHTVRTEPKRTAILTYTVCPNCSSRMRDDYERASETRDYCELYEPTYSSEDGSM